jgi:hypothetical protein
MMIDNTDRLIMIDDTDRSMMIDNTDRSTRLKYMKSIVINAYTSISMAINMQMIYLLHMCFLYVWL